MSRRHYARTWMMGILLLVALRVSAQGTEKAIEAAVLFGAIVLAAAVAGLVTSVLYLFKRRPWQRAVVIVFGIALLATGLFIGAQGGRSGDMDFLQRLLGWSGAVFVSIGAFVRPTARKVS